MDKRFFVRSTLLATMLMTLAAGHAQTITNTWTGAGDGVSWNDPANWDSGIPESDHVVRLGYALDKFGTTVTNVAQNIMIGESTAIHSLFLEPTGNREVVLNSENNAILTYSEGITMTDAAATDASVLVTTTATATYRRIRNDSATHELKLGPHTNTRAFDGTGRIRLTGETASQTRFYSAATFIVDTADTWVLSNQARFYANNPIIYWTRSSGIQRGWGGTASFGVIGGTEDDVIVQQHNLYSMSTEGGISPESDRIYLLDSPDGSRGTLIIQPASFLPDSLEIVTGTNSIVQFAATGGNTDRGIQYAANAGISGTGHFWKSNDITMPVQREMTYSGRTMLSGGTLQLSATNVNGTFYRGALPAGTLVELGAGATLDLNGLDQTMGGLLDWTGRFHDQDPTAGTVQLNGATLTVHSAQPTAFSGVFLGTGALVKSGQESFTLSGGYTNAAGRTLRIEDGLLAVTGALSVEAGIFELAGGRITADSLESSGTTWHVTLSPAHEDHPMVSVTDADIAGGQLILSLSEGYTPGIGKTFLLLNADETLSGASADGLFQYEDGEVFALGDGTQFRIDYLTGSEQVQLTVIPEPGSLGLWLLAGAGLAGWRRRRR